MYVLLNSKWKTRGRAPHSQDSRSAAKVAKQHSVSAGFRVLVLLYSSKECNISREWVSVSAPSIPCQI